MGHNQSSMEEPRLDDFFRDKLEDFSPPAYDPQAWANLEPRMPATLTGPILWYWISGTLGALLLFSWLYFLSAPSGERQIVAQLDSLQQQINQLSQVQTQIQKDTVYVYLSADSAQQLFADEDATTINKSLTQAQNSSIGRSANSRTNTNFNPKTEVNSPSALTGGDHLPIESPRNTAANVEEETEGTELNLAEDSEALAINAPLDTASSIMATPSDNAPIVIEDATKQGFENEDDSLKFLSTTPDSTLALTSETSSPKDSMLSVRPQPEAKNKKGRSRLPQNWMQTREIRAGIQMLGGGMLTENTGAGFRSGLELYIESNLNDGWWLGSGLNFAYRTYEGENENGGLDPVIIAALPGLVDPVNAQDLKEFYMRGSSLAIPLAIRREFYLNPNWDLALQASISAHRYLAQNFEYQSIIEERVDYKSTGTEQVWTLSPMRMTIMAIHNDRFRPSLGLYGEYDLIIRGVEPIRFWSMGMQVSFGLQLR